REQANAARLCGDHPQQERGPLPAHLRRAVPRRRELRGGESERRDHARDRRARLWRRSRAGLVAVRRARRPRDQGDAASPRGSGRVGRSRHVWLPAACALDGPAGAGAGRFPVRLRGGWATALLAPPVMFLIAFFVMPFLLVAVSSLQTKDGAWTAANYVTAATDLFYWRTLLLTFRISLWTVAISFIVGYPLAYYMTMVVKRRFVRRLFYIVVVTPLFTSNIVRSFGWMVLLGRRGLVNDALLGLGIVDRPVPIMFSELAVIIGLGYIMTPFMVLTVASVLQNIDTALLEASADLGANRLTTFLTITFPLSLPGVIAGSLIVFTLSVSAYVTPAIMSGGKQVVMSMLIFQQYGAVFDFNFCAS